MVRMILCAAASILLLGVTVLPAHAAVVQSEVTRTYTEQSLTTAAVPVGPVVTDEIEAIEILPEPPPAPFPAPVSLTPAAPAHSPTEGDLGARTDGVPVELLIVPASGSAGALLAAARAQLGEAQDCTALVERALRALGFQAGDLGTMDAAVYGTAISASEVQAGDIMMRGPNNGGHVSIYTGDGTNHQAIHGGFNGTTVETSIDADPNGYALFVRIP